MRFIVTLYVHCLYCCTDLNKHKKRRAACLRIEKCNELRVTPRRIITATLPLWMINVTAVMFDTRCLERAVVDCMKNRLHCLSCSVSKCQIMGQVFFPLLWASVRQRARSILCVFLLHLTVCRSWLAVRLMSQQEQVPHRLQVSLRSEQHILKWD